MDTCYKKNYSLFFSDPVTQISCPLLFFIIILILKIQLKLKTEVENYWPRINKTLGLNQVDDAYLLLLKLCLATDSWKFSQIALWKEMDLPAKPENENILSSYPAFLRCWRSKEARDREKGWANKADMQFEIILHQKRDWPETVERRPFSALLQGFPFLTVPQCPALNRPRAATGEGAEAESRSAKCFSLG